jgi:ATP-binding cassette subfamily B protein
MAGSERVFEIIDETPEADADPAQVLPPLRGEVIFDQVSFSYREGLPVLTEVSFQAHPGETVALIGPTGAGKTTIVNLLTRFYEIQSGSIRVDGRDIRSIPKAGLRRQLGVVLQDSFLFSASVRDTIGYDTILSERGSNLSHGQRQLLAIARAILADPKILILDEATSSVDTRTEQHIQEAMKHLMKGRTSFVIAHRLSTIREADQILVINHGRIIERGCHAELLARKGFYYRLSSEPNSAAAQSLMELEEEPVG